MGDSLLANISSIVIVGVGGTGSFLLTQLMRFLNSRSDVNKGFEIIIVDGDKYEESNVGRQEFAHSRMGKNKADVQTEVYSKKFPELRITSIPNYIGEENVKDIVRTNSIVFCCVDNHVCRRLLSERCQQLDDVLFISGGNEEFDGNVQAYFRCLGEALNFPIEKRHPEIMNTEDGDRSQMSCEELSQLPSGGQFILTNAMVGTLMVQLMYAYEHGTPNIENVNEIYCDIRQVKAVRIVNNQPE